MLAGVQVARNKIKIAAVASAIVHTMIMYTAVLGRRWIVYGDLRIYSRCNGSTDIKHS